MTRVKRRVPVGGDAIEASGILRAHLWVFARGQATPLRVTRVKGRRQRFRLTRMRLPEGMAVALRLLLQQSHVVHEGGCVMAEKKETKLTQGRAYGDPVALLRQMTSELDRVFE